jgi:hypothetical protein
MSTTLGGVTLAEPDQPAEIERVFVGEQTEAHDGTLLTDYTAVKLKWKLKWSFLSQAERDAVRTRSLVVASQSFSPPHEAGSYTVVVRQGSYRERPEPSDGTNTYYYVEFELEEAS